jgi:hypothetical protein
MLKQIIGKSKKSFKISYKQKKLRTYYFKDTSISYGTYKNNIKEGHPIFKFYLGEII